MAFGDADASTPAFVKANAVSKAATTASFTPPVGALLVAFAWHDTAGGNLTNTSVVTDTQGLTWTKRVTHSKQDDGSGANNGHLQVSTAVVASSVSMTVTTTGTNTNNPAALYVRVIAGADTTTPMDATPTEGHNTNAVISLAITTATAGARVFLIAEDWNLAANMTAGTSQTAIVADGIGAPDMRVYAGVQNAVTSPAGSVTMSTATPTTANTNNYAVVAIRPAAGGTTHSATAAATATATTTAAAAVDRPASATSTTTATVSAVASNTAAAAAASSTTATVTTAAAVDRPATAAATTTATITAAASVTGRVDADAALAVAASTTAAAAVTTAAGADLTASAALAATASVTRNAAAALTVTAHLVAATDGPDARATSSATVADQRTSEPAVAGHRTSEPTVTAEAASAPTVAAGRTSTTAVTARATSSGGVS